MLWRFSFASASTVDALLSRELPPTVEEVMDEQEVLNECKAQNNKLVTYLSREDSVKSLLQWVVAGLDELDQQAALADSASFDQAITSPSLYPSYQASQPPVVPGPGPNSPPLEPAKIGEGDDTKGDEATEAEEEGIPGGVLGIGLGEGLERQQSRDSDTSRYRYPQIATEILTSEVWTIAETIMAGKDSLLRPFWDAVLPMNEPTTPSTDDSMARFLLEQSERQRARDEFWTEKDEERDKKREVIRGYWTRVNGTLLSKRTSEMIQFIQSIPNVVDRLVSQIASPAVQDMLIRIISAEEAGVSGVIDWLAEEGLVPRLLAFLSPHYSTTMHSISSELLKSIITLCAPSSFNPNGGNALGQQQQGAQPGAPDNRMIRELVTEQSVNTMIGFMLDDIPLTDQDWKGLNDGNQPPHPADPFVVHPLPSLASAASSLSHICNMLVELIRRNNSDFSEPHLFHTLRQRLMTLQAQDPNLATSEIGDHNRTELENVMAEMSEKMGIVHLGNLITTISDRFEDLHRLFLHPRSEVRAKWTAPPSSSFSPPLLLERFRVVELYAELLHSSNMSILNRPAGTGPVYTPDGILSGGLAGLEKLGEAMDGDRTGEGEEETSPEEQVTQARELPVSSGSTDCSLTGSEEVGSDDEEMLEHIDDDTTPSPSPAASATLDPNPNPNSSSVAAQAHPEVVPPPPSQENAERLRTVMGIEPPNITSSATSDIGSVSHAAVAATTVAPSVISDTPDQPNASKSVKPPTEESLLPGDRLKQMYIQHRVLPAVIDLFFEFPNNDFMHHVVYDLIQQILNGRLGPGLNRELVIEMIKEAKLIERILDAQRLNDEMIKKPRTPRLAYMGHIILIAEELVKFFSRCPPDLFEVIQDSFVHSEWESFAEGSLRETKDRDARPLAGGKPMTTMSAAEALAKESEDSSSDEDEPNDGDLKFGEPLTRTSAADGFANRQSFETYNDRDGGDDDEYWRQGSSRRHVDSSDEDDDDADWLRPSASNLPGRGSEDEDFGEFHAQSPGAGSDGFDDDGWGVFTAPNTTDDYENPFGDDQFRPSVTPPSIAQPEALTPHDWASKFDQEFADNDLPAIVMPNLNDDEGDAEEGSGSGFIGGTATSGWTFTGDEDQAEDLPPTTSPVVEQTPQFESGPSHPSREPSRAGQVEEKEVVKATEGLTISPTQAAFPHDQSHAGRTGHHAHHAHHDHHAHGHGHHSDPLSQAQSPTSPITIPHRLSATGDDLPLPLHHIASPHGDAYSPPDPALIAAASEEDPLGPGVSPDTHVTKEGMLERQVEGHTVTVPQDEIVRGVEDAMERRHDEVGSQQR